MGLYCQQIIRSSPPADARGYNPLPSGRGPRNRENGSRLSPRSTQSDPCVNNLSSTLPRIICNRINRTRHRNIPAIHRLRAPICNHLGRNLWMKLHPIHSRPISISLIPALIRISQPLRAVWQIERLTMPMEKHLRRLHSSEESIVLSGVGEPHRLPSDFKLRILVHPCSQRAGNHL